MLLQPQDLDPPSSSPISRGINRHKLVMRVMVVLVGVVCIWSLQAQPQAGSALTSIGGETEQRAPIARAMSNTPVRLALSNRAVQETAVPDLAKDLLQNDLFKTERGQDELSDGDLAKAEMLTSKISAVEWLGPLAPIAISPFFGLTCLCGLSQFGGDLIGNNNFITTNPVLKNPYVFWAFLALTIFTTLPKLSKVSKPVAQLVDQLETYSAIVTLVVIRLAANIDTGDPAGEVALAAGAGAQVVQMGFISFTADMFLTVAAIINIVVVNTIKFFFEVLVWLTPVPTVDAIWELASKGICAALMGLYAWSPFVATVLNLILFAVCAVAYIWVHRQVLIMKAMLGDPIWSKISKAYGQPTKKQLTVFPRKSLGPFPARARVQLSPTQEGWLLEQKRWLLPTRSMAISKEDNQLDINHRGFLINRIEIEGTQPGRLLFSRRFADLDTVSQLLGITMSAKKAEEAAVGQARAEFS